VRLDPALAIRDVGLWTCLAAILVRLIQAWGIPMPSNDGAQYLWMSESFARGEFSAGMNSVFHSGSSFVHALFMQLGLESFAAARIDGALLGGLWVLLLHRICLRFADPLPAALVAILAVFSFEGVRLVAGVYSEPLYLVWISSALLLLLNGWLRWAALFVGSAFWIRPEALTLIPLLFWPGWHARERIQALAVASIAALSFVVLRAILLGDAAISPKFAVGVALGPLGATDIGGFVSGLANNVLRVMLVGVTALDGVGFGLGLVGLALMRSTETQRSRLLSLSLMLGWLVMCLFQVKGRFFISQAPLLLPLTAFALHRMRQLSDRDRGAHIALLVCTVVLVASILVATLRVGKDVVDPPLRDRESEIVLGRYLAEQLTQEDRITTDLPRVAWSAGRQPPPPTIWTAERLLAAIADRQPRYVILGRKRSAYGELRDTLLVSYRELELPSRVNDASGADRLALFELR
jgi:hypothetical protein